jgi:DNA-binding phage protein
LIPAAMFRCARIGAQCIGSIVVKTKTRRYDVANYSRTGRDVAGYFEAALDEGDPAVVAAALGEIARVHGMSKVARKTGSVASRQLPG